MAVRVSVIIPAHNVEPFLDECLESVLTQTALSTCSLEVSAYNDGSTDGTLALLQKWSPRFKEVGIAFVVGSGDNAGAAAARNRAVEQSTGDWLCMLDGDDIMRPTRIQRQLAAAEAASNPKNILVGSQFVREPADATAFWSEWANTLTPEEMVLQQYREVTLIQPTWFMHRELFQRVGGYVEKLDAPVEQEEEPAGKKRRLPAATQTALSWPVGEDNRFFYAVLDAGAALHRVDEPLIVYRHRGGSLVSNIPRRTLMAVRAEAFSRRVLPNWPNFTIWGAGRDGRNVYNTFSAVDRKKVVAFCDVDDKKISQGYKTPSGGFVPVVHWSKATPPLLICVAWKRGAGDALKVNIGTLRREDGSALVEGVDYWHFV